MTAALAGLARLGHRLAGLMHQLSRLAHLLAGPAQLAFHHRLAALIIGGAAAVFLATRRRRYRPAAPAPAQAPPANGGIAVAGTAVAAAIAYAAWLAKHPSPAKITAVAPKPTITQKIIHHTVIERIAAAHGIQGWQIVVALAIVVPILAWMIVRLNGHRGFW